MHIRSYDTVKFTDDIQRFAIVSRVHNGIPEFTLLIKLVNDGRAEVYDDTYIDPRDLLHDLRNGWYQGRGIAEPAYREAVRDLTAYVNGLADAGLNVARIND